MEKTFILFKPDAFKQQLVKTLIQALQAQALVIERSKQIEVDMTVMQTLLVHYQEVIDKTGSNFNFVGKLFNSFYFNGPHYLQLLEVSSTKGDIISFTRNLIGATEPISADPASLRGKYSQDSYAQADLEKRLVNNLIHASDSLASAQFELKLWNKYFD